MKVSSKMEAILAPTLTSAQLKHLNVTSMPSVQTHLAVLLVTVNQDSTEMVSPCVQRVSATINHVQPIKSVSPPLEVTASAKRALSFLIRKIPA